MKPPTSDRCSLRWWTTSTDQRQIFCQDMRSRSRGRGRTCLVVTRRTDQHRRGGVDGARQPGRRRLGASGRPRQEGTCGGQQRTRQPMTPTRWSRSSRPAPTSAKGSTGPSSTPCSSPSPLLVQRARAVQYVGRLLRNPSRASTTSSSTTTWKSGSPSSSACTPSGSPLTPPSASTSPRPDDEADRSEHWRRDRCLLTTGSTNSSSKSPWTPMATKATGASSRPSKMRSSFRCPQRSPGCRSWSPASTSTATNNVE